MRQWKIKRIATFDDDELANFITKIDSQPGCKVKEIIFIGNNSQDRRIYQIIYVEE
jgi:hypothetical protein